MNDGTPAHDARSPKNLNAPNDPGTLDEEQRRAVGEAVAALDLAEEPVPTEAFEALADPGLRARLAVVLAAGGRVLLRSERGWSSGYDDEIAQRLASEGVGVLRPSDRAVLTLVLLRTVAAPRALGRVSGADWSDARPTTIDELALHRHLTKSTIQSSVRRLRLAGILRPGHRANLVPGPQFHRLTPTQTARLWEDLVLACQPDGMLAHVIRRQRAAERVTLAPAGDTNAHTDAVVAR